ncbi:MAG: hypothetical protein ACR2JY_16830 [Chloroflexota bacterium]
MENGFGVAHDLGADLPAPRNGRPSGVGAVAEVTGLGEELAAYHAHFAPLFTRSEQRDWAAVYLQGLLTADVPRKNTEAMALRLLGPGPGRRRGCGRCSSSLGRAAGTTPPSWRRISGWWTKRWASRMASC